MPKNTTITLTPDELKLLLEAMEDEEFIMSIPLLLNDLDKEEFDAEKEAPFVMLINGQIINVFLVEF